ncbi:guanine nucleotide-binding protein subunit alpha [Pichia californica]|uniref:Guanine nucleotide-binding protein subunit alpha n=1 Tax=Pichia californica TaxID=460514 RepID=A0A9P6WJE8_9ASCO|nr:guanine nucleotide-binding protein subunit alpha [[Candida] californica]
MGCTASTPADNTNSNNIGNNGAITSKQAFTQQPDMDQLQKIQDNKVEKMMQKSKANKKNQVKMLLLGAGESGKSTVLKQMRLLHLGGFSSQERIQYKNIIWADTVASMQTLIIQARNLGIQLESDDPESPLYQYKQMILNYKPLESIDTPAAGGVAFLKDYLVKYSEKSAEERRNKSSGRADIGWLDENNSTDGTLVSDNLLNDYKETDELLKDYIVDKVNSPDLNKNSTNVSKNDIADSIIRLWKEDSGIKQCFNKSNLFQLEGSSPFFFENVQNYADDNYVCSDDDILKGRIKTTGITETNFNINGIKFKLLDAGGQRSERKKWIHCFQDITCACFVLAVSEYDQMLFEDEKVNRMYEAIMLFDSLVNSRWFADTPFILFLNKVDLLKDKVRKSPVRKYFPDYDGKSNDVEDALKYFEKLFLSLNKSKRPIYVHRTCATDTQSMKFILTAVTDMVIQQNLKKSGLF